MQLSNPTKIFKYKHYNINVVVVMNVVGNNVIKISNFFFFLNYGKWNSLVTQWLRVCTSTAGGMNSIPGQELTSHMPYGQKKKKKRVKIILPYMVIFTPPFLRVRVIYIYI